MSSSRTFFPIPVVHLVVGVRKAVSKKSDRNRVNIIIFSIYVFCGEATKKTSIDGLKW